MKNKTLKIMIMTFSIMLSIFCIGKEAKAAGGIVVSNITENSADLDWRSVVDDVPEGNSIKYVDVYMWHVGIASKDGKELAKGSTYGGGKLTGLPSGTYVAIYLYVYYTNHVSINEYDRFYSTSFTTKGTAPSPTTTTTTPTTTTPTTTKPTTTTTTTTTKLATPTITKVAAVGTRCDCIIGNYDGRSSSAEWKIVDKKTGKTIKTGTGASCSIYGLSRKVYYAQCRTSGYDSNYNRIYSDWSSPYYFVTQPKVTTTKKNLKVNSIKVKYKKVTGAKDYTIYAKKSNSKKWSKIKTTKKTSYTITKIKGKSFSLKNSRYDFTVVTNAKVGKKTIHSGKNEYKQCIVYYY